MKERYRQQNLSELTDCDFRGVSTFHRVRPALRPRLLVPVWIVLVTCVTYQIAMNSAVAFAFVFPAKVFSKNQGRLLSVAFSTHPPSQSDAATTTPSLLPGCQMVFDLQLPQGRCVGIQLEDLNDDHPDAITPTALDSQQQKQHWIHRYLHPLEIAHAKELPSERTQRSFIVGRLALRQALLPCGTCTDPAAGTPILKDTYGRPQMPPGFVGSISHKGTTGVALVALEDKEKGITVGVDLEEINTRRRGIASKVLTKKEQENLGRLSVSLFHYLYVRLLMHVKPSKAASPDVVNNQNVTADEEVLLRFSLKECIYKAVHPIICQYVGFQEAEVEPHENGTADCKWMLQSGAQKNFTDVSANWQRVGSFFLTTASAQHSNAFPRRYLSRKRGK